MVGEKALPLNLIPQVLAWDRSEELLHPFQFSFCPEPLLPLLLQLGTLDDIVLLNHRNQGLHEFHYKFHLLLLGALNLGLNILVTGLWASVAGVCVVRPLLLLRHWLN